MWPREKTCAALTQSSQRKCHSDEENVAEHNSKLILQVQEIHLEQNSHFASALYLHRDVCLLMSVCTPVREALVHSLSLKVLELGERGGERQEERDSVPILARFTGFS